MSQFFLVVLLTDHNKILSEAGKAALGFLTDQIRTLVSMATDSSNRVIMGKIGCFIFDRMQVARTTIKSRTS